MIRKDVIIAFIATFCLTASMFMVATSNSQVGEYNPWADYNDDGIIDIFDIVPGAVSFGAEGDPTKNVNVVNWPQNCAAMNGIFTWFSGEQIIEPYSSWWSGDISTAGFSQVTIYVSTNVSIFIWHAQYAVAYSPTYGYESLESDQREFGPGEFTRTYDVKGDTLRVMTSNTFSSSAASVKCFIYMNSVPSIQAPTYDEQRSRINITTTTGGYSTQFNCYGFSRLSLGVKPIAATAGTYDITLRVDSVTWLVGGGVTSEPLANPLNVTFLAHDDGSLSYLSHPPLFLETKGTIASFTWRVTSSHNLPPNWFIAFYTCAYLRNE